MMKHRASIALGLVLFLVLAGTGAGHAYWSAQSSVTASVSADRLSIDQVGFGDLAFTYTQGSSVTKPVTVKNTSGGSANYTLALTSAADGLALAQQTTVRTWVHTLVSPCATMPGTASTATWNAVAPLTGTLAAGASVTYCVRSMPAANSTNPNGVITATATATASAGSWTSAPVVTTITQTTLDWTAPVFTTQPKMVAATDTSLVLSRGVASDNFGVDGYDLSGFSRSAGIASTHRITGLTRGTAYTYTITAHDTAGNTAAVTGLTANTLPVAPSVAYTVARQGDSRCFSNSDPQSGDVTVSNCGSAASATQQWLFTLVDGSYAVSSAASQSGVWRFSNSTLAMSTSTISAAMKWTLLGSGDTYQFRNDNSGLCLVDSGNGNGRKVTMQDVCDASHANQRFSVKAVQAP